MFWSSVLETLTKTEYIFLVINHSITAAQADQYGNVLDVKLGVAQSALGALGRL